MTCQGGRGRVCWPRLSLRSAEHQEGRKFRTQQGTGWRGGCRSPRVGRGQGCMTGINTRGRCRALQETCVSAHRGLDQLQGCSYHPRPATTPQLSYTHPSDAARSRGGPHSGASVPAGQDAHLWPTAAPTPGSLLPGWREHTTGRLRVQKPWGPDPQNTAPPPAPSNPWTRAAGESGVRPGRKAAPALGKHSCGQ